MNSDEKTIYYIELQAGDPVQDGDQFRDADGQWKPYIFKAHMGGTVGFGVTARRPICATHQTTYEEVPGSRTTQGTVVQPQRERIAYEELRVGDHIQDGDQWQNDDGRWQLFSVAPIQVRQGSRVRRPYKISAILEIGDALANAQQAATQLQDERDEARKAVTQMMEQLTNQAEVLVEVRADEKRLFDDLELLRSEYIKLQAERDNALAAVKSAQRARDELQRQVDELRAGLMGVVSAEHVYSMLRDMLDQTEWVGQCLDSSTYEQMSCIQRTISVIAERVSEMGKEATSAND